MSTDKKRIAIVTSGHSPFDDRIFWKFALSLSKIYDVCIISSQLQIDTIRDGIRIKGFTEYTKRKDKINKFALLIKDFNPDLIICSQPLTVLAAKKSIKKNSDCKIIYDITEWYPENVAFKFKGLKRILIYVKLFISNLIVTNSSDSIILGEITKKRRYDIIAPLKSKTIIGYYPVLKYFKHTKLIRNPKQITLCYAGIITFERGIIQLYNAAVLLADKRPELRVEIIIAGKFSYMEEKNKYHEFVNQQSKVIITFKDWTDYDKIYDLMSNADICLDLRNRNFIYRNSLPIKIFEYMACGKPFICSDIEPIRKELNNIECGFLVDPDNVDEIVSKIELYLDDNALLLKHSQNGREIIEKEKNWDLESKKLLNLVERLLK